MKTDFIKSAMERKKAQQEELHIAPIAAFVFALCLMAAVFGSILADKKFSDAAVGSWVVIWTLLGVFILFGLKVASQWEKAVVLRLGKFHGLKGPGMFWIVPIMDTVTSWIDHRVVVTSFSAEKT